MSRWIAALVLLLCASPALAQKLTVWDAKAGGDAKTYAMGSYVLTLSAEKNEDGLPVPFVTVRAPGAEPGELDGEAGFANASASFAVARIDPKSAAPQVILVTYIGGAHCCDSIKVLERAGRGWTTVDLGIWDGDQFDSVPRDVDGDGVADFVFVDNAFLYAFDAYAFSWAPPKILNLVGGKVIDVSTARRYRALYLADMGKAKVECAKHTNGACAGYVADAARLGLTKEAWAFMLAHYDRAANWDYPTHCNGRAAQSPCKGAVIKPRDYPQALAWFLKDYGYTQ